MDRFQNILVVRTDRIGDVVLTTPAIKALRQSCPWAKITMLVTPLTRDLVAGNFCLDEILVDDRRGIHAGFWGFLRLVLAVRRRKFDLAVIYHTKKRTNFLCWAAGIPRRIGYKNEKFGFLLTDPLEDQRHQGHRHEAQYCLDVLRHLGICRDDILNKPLAALSEDVTVPVSAPVQQWVDQFCQQQNISANDTLIAIHPGASDPAKQWPPYHFAALIDRIASRYPARIVLVGTSHLAGIAREIISRSPVPILDLTGKTTVGQLAGILKRCHLLVSNDSGPVHVAAGVRTPVVSIFTRNRPGINPERWQPLGKRVRVVSVPPLEGDAANPPQPVSLQAVLEAVDSSMAKLGKNGGASQSQL